jgi:hypothetical protein
MADVTMDFEVFAPGQYHAFPAFTAGDLDQMVANFDRLKGFIKPPLKAGHSTAQLLAGQTDGDPALGWCTALRRAGNKLVGTFAGIPDKFAALIRKGRYLRGSSEIVLDWAKCADEANLKTGVEGKVFTGFAVLGADVPAVKNLTDLADFLGAASPLHFSEPAADVLHADAPLMGRSYADGSLRDFDADVCAAVLDRFGPESCVHDVFPDRVIVATGDGLVACPITRDAEGDVELGEPAPVTVNYAPTDPMVAASCSHAGIQTPAALLAARKDNAMSEEIASDDGVALAKLTDLEAKLSAFQVELAEKNARIDALAKESQEARTREIAAESRARHAEAVEWVKTFSEAGNLRILPAQRALATVLRERLVAADATITADALVGCFAQGETPSDQTLAQLFARFVQGLPDQKVMLTEVTKDAPPVADALEAFITARAAEMKLSATDPVVRRDLSLQWAAAQKAS